MFTQSKKILLLATCFLAVNLFSQTITFNTLEKNPQRVVPNTPQQIFSFHDLIKDSVNSVVNISAKKHVNRTSNIPSQMLNDPFFKKFFGEEFGNLFNENRIQRSLGSGLLFQKMDILLRIITSLIMPMKSLLLYQVIKMNIQQKSLAKMLIRI